MEKDQLLKSRAMQAPPTGRGSHTCRQEWPTLRVSQRPGAPLAPQPPRKAQLSLEPASYRGTTSLQAGL